mmetsp:Transcript_96419/g.171417  ORF Transcript_96419/g.171417 Transcript_96419/m.171417 type:complete len:262 (-) Transcript_96419:1245-2030(-)
MPVRPLSQSKNSRSCLRSWFLQLTQVCLSCRCHIGLGTLFLFGAVIFSSFVFGRRPLGPREVPLVEEDDLVQGEHPFPVDIKCTKQALGVANEAIHAAGMAPFFQRQAVGAIIVKDCECRLHSPKFRISPLPEIREDKRRCFVDFLERDAAREVLVEGTPSTRNIAGVADLATGLLELRPATPVAVVCIKREAPCLQVVPVLIQEQLLHFLTGGLIGSGCEELRQLPSIQKVKVVLLELAVATYVETSEQQFCRQVRVEVP